VSDAVEDERLEHALGLAYHYLNRRDRTVSEVRRHLGGRRVDATTAEETIRTLAEQGYLDDERFARLYAEDKRGLEQWGAERISQGLVARGIDREMIDEVVAAPSVETELERARALLEKRFPVPPRDRRERDRALGVLLRRGYESELALDALRAYARGVEDEAA
jgi:regulatory protein